MFSFIGKIDKIEKKICIFKEVLEVTHTILSRRHSVQFIICVRYFIILYPAAILPPEVFQEKTEPLLQWEKS